MKELAETWVCLNTLERKIWKMSPKILMDEKIWRTWKSNQKFVMNEEFVQGHRVMNEELVQDIVMNEELIPNGVMDEKNVKNFCDGCQD